MSELWFLSSKSKSEILWHLDHQILYKGTLVHFNSIIIHFICIMGITTREYFFSSFFASNCQSFLLQRGGWATDFSLVGKGATDLP